MLIRLKTFMNPQIKGASKLDQKKDGMNNGIPLPTTRPIF